MMSRCNPSRKKKGCKIHANKFSFSRKRFGSDLNILPENNKNVSSQLVERKLNLIPYRSDHEIHTPGHRNGNFGETFFDHVSLDVKIKVQKRAACIELLMFST